MEQQDLRSDVASPRRTTRACKASCRSNTGTNPTCIFADLRTTSGDFATIDYSENPPLLFLGRAVEFDDLHLKNLR